MAGWWIESVLFSRSLSLRSMDPVLLFCICYILWFCVWFASVMILLVLLTIPLSSFVCETYKNIYKMVHPAPTSMLCGWVETTQLVWLHREEDFLPRCYSYKIRPNSIKFVVKYSSTQRQALPEKSFGVSSRKIPLPHWSSTRFLLSTNSSTLLEAVTDNNDLAVVYGLGVAAYVVWVLLLLLL